MQELKIGFNDAGQRFDKYLHKALPGAGSSFLYKQLRKKNITLNGKKAEGREILQNGDMVQCFFSEETFLKFQGRSAEDGICTDSEGKQDSSQSSGHSSVRVRGTVGREREFQEAYSTFKGITVLYEDKHILILNKPAGVLTQKADAGDLSLNEWMIGYLLQSGCYTEEELRTFHPSICNRLDRNTSGLVLCGKSLAGSQALSFLLKEHLLRKFYKTVCHGRLTEEQVLDGHLIKDPVNNKVKVLVNGASDSAPIRTKYIPLRSTESHTLLEVELFSGKTHQIRAHLASIGHPLLGDAKYGNKKENAETAAIYHIRHHLLHADHVIFPDWENIPEELSPYEEVLKPLRGKKIQAPLPELFRRIEKNIWK